MNYWEEIDRELKPKVDKELDTNVLDLFAGCGGLSLGFESVGFKTVGYEMNQYAVETYNANLIGNCFCEKLSPETQYEQANVVIGGPPCQPFSVGGKQQGLKDSRDGFPIFIEAVRQLEPEVFLFENVRGMLYKNKWYLLEVIEALSQLGYKISYALMNAKHYEVPQNRERVIVIGAREMISLPRRINRKVTAGDALGELAFQFDSNSKFFTKSMDAYVAKYEKASHCKNPRDLYLDRPARTLTCRNLAGATGDMHRVRLKDGRRRRITVREAARLQSFPDWFKFQGNETSQYNQIGNAVAPLFAKHLAQSVKDYLQGNQSNALALDGTDQLSLFESEGVYR